ncbi:Pentapeptide repeat-containing protein [Saccharopolyspora kobensis]|uniref:Pentapeptide repeat-containing protein n=1 Tax=Saccharopolyspora kobensis TaxID=146035 RepID=A0A1H6E2L3_9PSEU|nr:pentapeptide repeat-containing protein [Saccharopolyspora kobensis]SEG91145.1 Pentapeptide repeat-containing protein [Saccharopolyspora kobensis]SFF13970.1 Pentapeptide repeat-containing protein [Saccharopolyspora kobensis]
MRERRIWLVATIAIAVVVLLGVSAALLVFDPRTTGADALRTGGLAAGSVVALYALWLNDRRRRTEEQRQQVERERYELEDRRVELDRDRIADERFARAIELLGHETDQVRVGALHALAGLARNRPDYTQTVLDVLCSYLRRPFEHPRYGGDWPDRSARNNAERKLQVRLTAQRLIEELLPRVDDADAPAYDLDLTGATLEYFDLSDRKIGTLTLRYGRLFSDNNFSRCEFHGKVWFTAATIGPGRLYGRFRCDDAVFHQLAWFPGTEFSGRATFRRTRFTGTTKFDKSRFGNALSMAGAEFHGEADFREACFEHDVDMSGTTFRGEVRNDGITTSPDHDVVLPEGWAAAAR